MEKIIYNNCSLQYIIDAITNGTIGWDEKELKIEDLYISHVETSQSPQFHNILIKPTITNCSEESALVLGDNKFEVDLIENHIYNFIIYTVAQEHNDDTDKTEMVLMCQSLLEYLMMFPDFKEILKMNIWKLYSIK